jgi:citrate synthase
MPDTPAHPESSRRPTRAGTVGPGGACTARPIPEGQAARPIPEGDTAGRVPEGDTVRPGPESDRVERMAEQTTEQLTGEPPDPGEPGDHDREWIGAAEAADRLGIKPASLYAYVSRGVLARRRDPVGRGSLFDAAEIAELARRGRPRRPAPGGELVIESALTEITPDSVRYRGRDLMDLAARATFEEVALLLWSADPDHPAATAVPWQATPAALAAGTAAQAALPPGILPLERLQVIVPALAATDPLRLHLDRPAVIAAARALIAGMADCLPPSHAPTAGHDPIAVRLTRALHPGPPPPGLSHVVQTAMVLLADHDLAASTLAARVAASVRADPYAVVATGLGALAGALHGGASLATEAMLATADSPESAPHVVGDLVRRGQRLPGLGHFAYPDGDPRCVRLLAVIRAYAPDSPRLAAATAIIAEARRRALPEPNVDFALAVLTSVAGLVPGSGEAIFAIARAAGWIAHALEEYDRRTPIRPRSIYTGPPPI